MRNVRAGSLVVSLLVVLSITSAVSAEPAPRHATSQIDWLAVVNYYRAQAGLAPVAEIHERSDGAYKHSLYGVKTGTLEHYEDESSPWYTPEGHDAASGGSILKGGSFGASERAMIADFMTTPIHGQFLWDIQLDDLGYGYYEEEGMGSRMSFSSGRYQERQAPADHYPVVWPGPGTVVPFATGRDEIPSYREICGFSEGQTWGLPIGFQMKYEQVGEPSIFTHTVTSNGAPVPHCEYHWGAKIFLIPNAPLVPGQSYEASVTLEEATASTNFSVTKMPLVACPLTAPAGQQVELTFANFRDNSYAPGQDSPADYGWVDIIFDGNMYVMGDRVEVGDSSGEYDVIGSYTFPTPGIYNFRVLVADPYGTRHETTGSVNVTQGGAVSKGECSAPPLPPEPSKPPMRPRPPLASDVPPDPSNYPSDDPDPGPQLYERNVSLQLKRHLRAVGSVTMAESVSGCLVGRTVVIERIYRKRWTFLDTAVTDSTGAYKIRLPDNPGRYRAILDPYELPDDSGCSAAQSTAVRHTH